MAQPSLNPRQWQCPACDPTVMVYALVTPSNQLVVLVSGQTTNGEIHTHCHDLDMAQPSLNPRQWQCPACDPTVGVRV